MKWVKLKGDFFWEYLISDSGLIMHDNICIKQSNSNGYKVVKLRLTNNKFKQYKVHRLVAEAFIPNPNNYPCVNHKDENKANNCVNNLEWCTVRYNNCYGTRPNKIRQANSRRGCPDSVKNKIKQSVTSKQGRAVDMYSRDGKYIKTFQSTKDAERETGIPHNIISYICNGKRTNKNYKFIYSVKEVLK